MQVLWGSRRRYAHLVRGRRSESALTHHSFLLSKTINHRRVVQEVYDRQILHRMLGLVPQPPLSVKDTTSGRASRKAEAESVEDAHAWGEADMETSNDSQSEVEAAAESRYDIESRKQPPKKRRRTGTRADENITLHTVYTTDEEDGYLAGHQPRDADDGITEEEEEYAVSALDGADQERGGGKAEKRSYWLSKAMARGGTDSDD